MNLVIDAGNSFTKAALFKKGEIVDTWKVASSGLDELGKIPSQFTIDAAIISDVSNVTQRLAPMLKTFSRVIQMSAQTLTPLKLSYTSPESLGSDRLAAAVCASHLWPGHPVLAIQAGTCITYELVTQNRDYQGGSISPGTDMRFQAMHNFTAKLPLVKKEQINFLTGTNTNDCILSGVVNGCIAEIDGIIDQYKETYPELKIVMGGGDTFFFDKKLKNRIFAVENLVLRGLNIILDHNLNVKNH